MLPTRSLSLLAAVFVAGLLAVSQAGCGEPSLKASGETCRATSECGAGLLCDFASDPAVCAGEGSEPRPIDAAPADDDATGPLIDAAVDAPVDAAVDAAIDAAAL